MSFSFERIRWDDDAAKHLMKASGSECPVKYVQWLRGEVEAERAALIAVSDALGRVGSMVLRDEVSPAGRREVVFVAVGGAKPGALLYRDCLPHCLGLVKQVGGEVMRCHAIRRGAAYWLKKAGFFGIREGGEWVFRKAV